MGSKKTKRTLSHVIYAIVSDFEPAKILVYSDQIERVKDLQRSLKQYPFDHGESAMFYKRLRKAYFRISKKKIELGYSGFDGFESCIDYKDLEKLPQVYFSSYFLHQLGPMGSNSAEGKARIISTVRKKDRELLVWKKLEN